MSKSIEVITALIYQVKTDVAQIEKYLEDRKYYLSGLEAALSELNIPTHST